MLIEVNELVKSSTVSKEQEDEGNSNEPVIGIDLGTTFCCVYVWKDGMLDLVVNDQGSRTTPSYIAFTDTERLIGEPAKDQAEENPENTIFNIKRLIGIPFTSDKDFQNILKSLPFTVVNKNGKPAIKVQAFGQTETFYPEEISAMLLRKFKMDAEKFLGETVEKAVITVPEHFNTEQRQATKLAAEIAGFNVLCILNEPTAAVLAYGINRHITDYRSVLVFDLGGGTFDVTVMSLGDHVLEASATNGNKHLGGEDFVNNLVSYCLEDKDLNKLDCLKTDKRSLQRLRNECEKGKKALSTSMQMQINLSGLFGVKAFKKTISRTKFNQLNKDRFSECMKCVKDVLKDAGMEASEIAEVMLVGGSSRIPMIQDALKKLFTEAIFNSIANPDEVVAQGAALRAANMTANRKDEIRKWAFTDVTSYSLGIETSKQDMQKLIKRNEKLPIESNIFVKTSKDNQTRAGIKIFEGEDPLTKKNNLLAKFTLFGLMPKKRGEVKVNVHFHLSAQGLLTATAKDDTNQVTAKKRIQITLDGAFTQREIQNMKMRCAKYQQIDLKKEAGLVAKGEFEEVCNSLMEKEERNEQIQEVHQWLQNSENKLFEPNVYLERLKSLKRFMENEEYSQVQTKIMKFADA